MAIRKLSANLIYTGTGKTLRDKVIVLDDNHIVDIKGLSELPETEVEWFEGALCPGFINAHCHLELSHLKSHIPKHTGLPEFLMTVPSLRVEQTEDMLQAANTLMWKNGIQAVGDISNNDASFKTKAHSPIRYFTFIELLGLAIDERNAEKSIDQGVKHWQALRQYNLDGSISPHAPYSTSAKHLNLIAEWCILRDLPATIHMQESKDEFDFIYYGSGSYFDLYEQLGFPIPFVKAKKKTSLDFVLSEMEGVDDLLLVHNTVAELEDIQMALMKGASHCFCPNANLYIEDKLPDIPKFIDAGVKPCIGTDSLASNDDLSILSEIKTIQTNFPQYSTQRLIQWACKNGADFFGWNDLGSIEIGMEPGIVQLSGLSPNEAIEDQTKAIRII